MKTAIIYASVHHGNTKKIIDEIAKSNEVDLIDATQVTEKDLSGYDLIIHCGACMFNRRHVMSRIDRAKSQGVPITNYGVAIAKLSGILDKIDL